MTEDEFKKHISECKVCLNWVALCMVEPIRGYPSPESRQVRDADNILSRVEYWRDNKKDLLKCGIHYDPSSERIGKYKNTYKYMDKG